jgi:hypothetical protein
MAPPEAPKRPDDGTWERDSDDKLHPVEERGTSTSLVLTRWGTQQPDSRTTRNRGIRATHRRRLPMS